jgi:hypothetical protein
MVRVFPFDPPDPVDPLLSDVELVGVLRDTSALASHVAAQQARVLRELRCGRLARQA